MSIFDPNGVGIKGTLFGLPYDAESADIVVIPIPWDVTVSYGAGTAEGPEAILNASSQIDYEIPSEDAPWRTKVAMLEIPEVWHNLGKQLRVKAEFYINKLEEGDFESEELVVIKDDINEQCAQLTSYIEQETSFWRVKGKKTILLGGDHSTPLGHINSLSLSHKEFGILQIDAHADLRQAYEGFTFSHASIMHNVLKNPAITHLVQVGVRDYCEEEMKAIQSQKGRINTFFDQDLKEAQFQGKLWHDQCHDILENLPDKVYVSFDIDGLDPKYCPNTGTPVPGGLETDQVFYLFKMLKASGREIIGADLNEVAPGDNEWDANVGSRVLWRLVQLLNSSTTK